MTLAEYSGFLVEKTLERQNKRTRRTTTPLKQLLHENENENESESENENENGGGACGAPAARNARDARNAREKKKQEEEEEQEEEEGVEWEDIEEHENIESDGEEEKEGGSGAEGGSGGGSRAGGTLVVDVDMEDPLAFGHDRQVVKEWAAHVHRTHLLLLVARGQVLDDIANDCVVQGRVLSKVPKHLLPNSSGTSTQIKPLVKYFSTTFKCMAPMPTQPQSQASGLEERVHDCIRDGHGEEEEIMVAFAALCRSLGLLTRLVCSMEPLSRYPKKAFVSYKENVDKGLLKSSQHRDDGNGGGDDSGDSGAAASKANDSGENSNSKKKKSTGKNWGSWEQDEKGVVEVVSVKRKKSSVKRRAANLKALNGIHSSKDASNHLPRYWVEVCFHSNKSSAGMAWESIDPITGEIGSSELYEKGNIRRKGFSCVAAFLGGGVKDVTQRYAVNFHSSTKEIDRPWWERTISHLKGAEAKAILDHMVRVSKQSAKGTRSGGITRTKAEKALDCQLCEDAALSERTLKQMRVNWPKTLTAAKNHPYYVLVRHLNKNEALVPGAKMTGKFLKAEPLYLRSDVRRLKSADAWLKAGRQVKESELANPFVPYDACGGDSKDSKDPKDSKAPKVYGEWQTEDYVPPVVEDGVIPKNEYGNVLCPPLVPMLPRGLVRLSFPRIARICRKLHLDYAPAVVGFERRSGRYTPSVDGVVVLESSQELVLEHYLEEETRRAEQEERKRRREEEVRRAKEERRNQIQQDLKKEYLEPKEKEEEEGEGACIRVQDVELEEI